MSQTNKDPNLVLYFFLFLQKIIGHHSLNKFYTFWKFGHLVVRYGSCFWYFLHKTVIFIKLHVHIQFVVELQIWKRY